MDNGYGHWLTLLGPRQHWLLPQPSFLDSFQKVVDFNDIINATVAVICKALHYCVWFLVECNILV